MNHLVDVRLPAQSVEDFRQRDIVFDKAVDHDEEFLKHCDLCGRAFWRPTSEWAYKLSSQWYERSRGREQKTNWPAFFCSYTCLCRAKRMAEEEKRRRSHALKCQYCGKPFYSPDPAARYCGKQCWVDANSLRKSQEYEQRLRARGFVTKRDENGKLMTLRTCATCGREYWSFANNGKYCTERCRTRGARKTEKGRLEQIRLAHTGEPRREGSRVCADRRPDDRAFQAGAAPRRTGTV